MIPSDSISPFKKLELVTPGSTKLGARGFYVGGTAGNITFVDASGNTITDYPVAANSYHPVAVDQITAATATPIYVGF